MSWETVTIAQFDEIRRVIMDSELSDPMRMVHLLSVVKRCSVEDVLSIRQSDFPRELEAVKFLLTTMPEPRAPKRRQVTAGACKYTHAKDLKNMSTGQYIDYTETLKNPTAELADTIAILMVPNGAEYGIGYDVADAREELRENMLIEEAIYVVRFFAMASRRSSVHSLKSSLRAMKKQLKKSKTEEQMSAEREAIKNMEDAYRLMRAGSGLSSLGMFRNTRGFRFLKWKGFRSVIRSSTGVISSRNRMKTHESPNKNN